MAATEIVTVHGVDGRLSLREPALALGEGLPTSPKRPAAGLPDLWSPLGRLVCGAGEPRTARAEIELIRLAIGPQGVEVALLDLADFADSADVAARFLSQQELGEYARLRHEGRRRQWLGARVCLKTMLLRRRCVGDPRDCRVAKDARGRPRVVFRDAKEHGFCGANGGHAAGAVVHDCSLSHTPRFVCACLCTRPGLRVGADVERVSPRLERASGAFVHPGDSLRSCSPGIDEGLAILWTLKEACSKAVGLGLGLGLGEIACEEIRPGHHRLLRAGQPPIRARHVLHEDHVVALSLIPKVGQ